MTSMQEDFSDSDVLISVRNVNKCYHLYDRPQDRLLQSLFRGRKKFYRDFWALKDVSLKIIRGEAIGIIGRNGAGKSTLLQLIAGTLTPTSGEISVTGRVTALLQLGSGFNPEFTGRENVFLNGAILGFSRAEIEQRFDEIAAFADIGDFIEQSVKTYSSGMTMRLAFAVSVCLEPDVLIVDEALSVGDALFQFKCRNRLEDLISKGTTLLFVSHDMDMIKSFCNRVIYLENGQTKFEGEPIEITELYALDIRADQAKSLSVANTDLWVVEKKSNGGFGNKLGEIITYEFISTEHNYATFLHDQLIEFKVLCIFSEEIKNPTLSVQVQSPNLLAIGGRWITLEKTSTNKVWVVVRFQAKLNIGKYFVTLRLEDRKDLYDFFPIHKIPGALHFEITNIGRKPLLGYCDLDFSVDTNVTE